MLKSKYIGLLFLVLAILMACQYPSPVTLSGDMPQKKRDSVNYLMERHYTLNVSIRPRACFSPSYNKVKSQTKHVWLLTLL